MFSSWFRRDGKPKRNRVREIRESRAEYVGNDADETDRGEKTIDEIGTNGDNNDSREETKVRQEARADETRINANKNLKTGYQRIPVSLHTVRVDNTDKTTVGLLLSVETGPYFLHSHVGLLLDVPASILRDRQQLF